MRTPAVVVAPVVVVASIELSLPLTSPPPWIDIYQFAARLHPTTLYLSTNRVLINENQHFDVVQYWLDRYESQPDLARFALDILAVPSISDECGRLFSSCKILIEDRRARLQMDIIEVNEVLWHAYGPSPKGTFDSQEVGELEGESCERIPLKAAAKAWLAAAVAEAAAQVEDDGVNNEEDLEDLEN